MPIPRRGGVAFRALSFIYLTGPSTIAEIAHGTKMTQHSVRNSLYEYNLDRTGDRFHCPPYLKEHFREAELHAARQAVPLVAAPKHEFKPLRPQGPQARRPGAEDYKTYPSLFNGERIPYAGIKSFAS